jgi:membrane protein DedA with SNARE-associated domain
MTQMRLAVFCAIGATMWGGIFGVLSHFGILTIDWSETAHWTVITVLAVFVVGALWIRVGRDDAELEYQDQLQHESEGMDYDEYEQPLPPAA